MMDFQDGFSGELDAALRKSWSESQRDVSNDDEVEDFFKNGGRMGNALGGLMNSPIGTPSNVSQYEMDLDVETDTEVTEAATRDSTAASTNTSTNASTKNSGETPLFNENVGSIIVTHALDSRHSPSPHSSTTDTKTASQQGDGRAQHPTTSHRESFNKSEELRHDQNSDYQIFKHHYSMPDNKKESVTNILNDLNLGSEQEEKADPGIVPLRKRSSNSMSTARRSSVQDIQWMRQLLNPRSSFSGTSVNEPVLTTNKSGSIETNSSLASASTSSSDHPPNKCWVTVIDRDEIIPAIVVLHRTLRSSNSKYDLVVLHPYTFDPSELHRRGITSTISFSECVATDLNDPALQLNSEQETRTIIANWNKLSVFLSLVGHYDLVCYISPSCMVLQNIDDLLDSQEIFDEIDNEMCVLLTNQDSTKKDEKDPQIIMLKPNKEVAMCIREFFTVYSNSAQERKNKLMKLKDLDVLKELFGDTWGYISTDSYCKTIQHDEAFPRGNSMIRIIDFKNLAPWDHLHNTIVNDDTLCARWFSTFKS
ncbi:IME2-dependent-signaling protein [Nakaseomyces bracarensis]|uniref:IME2-dependent-signaling protein n=1 Tax=Nakaseomyces bracarensis TaxID=273131 RepID=A0ABR4NQU0_9SACH